MRADLHGKARRAALAHGRRARPARALIAACVLLGTLLVRGPCFMEMLRRQGRPSPSSSSAEVTKSDSGFGAAGGSDPVDPIMREFDSPSRQALLKELQDKWDASIDRLRAAYPEIDEDPFFATDLPSLLRRYLVSAKFDAEEAMSRLQATAEWRRDWDVMSYYRPGVARELFAEATNPGSEMYFADSLGFDRLGRPYMAGRIGFANPENMHPWHHLRAGIMVFEMLATKVAQIGRGPGSYILDIGSVGNIAGSVSGTAGLDREYDESKNPYYNAGAGKADAPSPRMLEEFGSLDNGFAVLKAAIQVLNRHYPGVVTRVYYLNSSMLFWGAFKVFSTWVADRGSIKFGFLGPVGWREEPISKLLEAYPPAQLFTEWGGTGPSLDGDGFLARAIEHYEEEAAKRANTATGGSSMQGKAARETHAGKQKVLNPM